MILRARLILPLAGAPIENGALVFEGARLQWIGPWRDCATIGHRVADLGEVALLPGLINAHCHLDYTRMAGRIPPPKVFPDWIKTILSFKAHWGFSEFAESWLSGARMLLEGGVTTVADIESVPELLPEVWKSCPLRLFSFLELTGVKARRDPQALLHEALGQIEALPVDERHQAGLSPHSLYATSSQLRAKVASLMRERRILTAIHLSESESEYQMFTDASGPFFDWLKGQRDMSDCGHGSPVRLADEEGLLTDRTLAIHVNYLAPGDVERLARAGTTVVHCPSSHEYFGHAPFPFPSLREAGVNLCLGTDSLASSLKKGAAFPRLDLREEMRQFARQHPGLSPREIFELCTVRPAQALHQPGALGVLMPGCFADCSAWTYSGPARESAALERLLFESNVREVFVGGELVQGG